jgi:hypothetical protein
VSFRLRGKCDALAQLPYGGRLAKDSRRVRLSERTDIPFVDMKERRDTCLPACVE